MQTPNAKPSSRYFALSKSPRYSLTFALPLLIFYELMAAVIQGPTGGLRNGADVILKALFATVAGPRGPLIFTGLLIVTLLGLVMRDRRRNPGPLRVRLFLLMFAESSAMATLFGGVVGIITARLVASLALLHSMQPTPRGPLERMPLATAVTVSLGAGLYEELLFRVLLVGALMLVAKRILGMGPIASRIVAVLGGALVFAAFHYIGPYGDTPAIGSFVFRTVAGLAFSGLYVTRGFGITAWTHALYDVFFLLTRL